MLALLLGLLLPRLRLPLRDCRISQRRRQQKSPYLPDPWFHASPPASPNGIIHPLTNPLWILRCRLLQKGFLCPARFLRSVLTPRAILSKFVRDNHGGAQNSGRASLEARRKRRELPGNKGVQRSANHIRRTTQSRRRNRSPSTSPSRAQFPRPKDPRLQLRSRRRRLLNRSAAVSRTPSQAERTGILAISSTARISLVKNGSAYFTSIIRP